jgi:hypothetical protein
MWWASPPREAKADYEIPYWIVVVVYMKWQYYDYTQGTASLVAVDVDGWEDANVF